MAVGNRTKGRGGRGSNAWPRIGLLLTASRGLSLALCPVPSLTTTPFPYGSRLLGRADFGLGRARLGGGLVELGRATLGLGSTGGGLAEQLGGVGGVGRVDDRSGGGRRRAGAGLGDLAALGDNGEL